MYGTLSYSRELETAHAGEFQRERGIEGYKTSGARDEIMHLGDFKGSLTG